MGGVRLKKKSWVDGGGETAAGEDLGVRLGHWLGRSGFMFSLAAVVGGGGGGGGGVLIEVVVS